MKIVNFNAVKNVKVPKRWIENAIKAKMKKHK